MKYTKHYNEREEKVREGLFAVDKWIRLQRFLVMGTEGGSYYASESKLTKDNAKSAVSCIEEDGRKVVDCAVEISQTGRAPKNDAALFVLALVASKGNVEAKTYALQEMHKVARTGRHLFQFISMLRDLRGWSKAVSRAVNRWYNNKTAKKVAFQVTKYQNREGWSHRDLLRLSHIKAVDEDHNLVYHWAVRGVLPPEIVKSEAAEYIQAFETVKRATTRDDEVVELIERYKLPWECIPSDRRNANIWESLLFSGSLEPEALIRNLSTLSSRGILIEGRGAVIGAVQEILADPERLKRSRLHPMKILVALKNYARGLALKGHSRWTVVKEVKDVLEDAFYLSFGNVEPTNKRTMLALDVSSSMDGHKINGLSGISPRLASAAMAMVTHRTEPMTLPMAFSHKLTAAPLFKHASLEETIRQLSRVPMGGTNCSLPMLHAMHNNIEIDTFVMYTDNETFFGGVHPSEALRQYREKMGIDAKMIICGMVSNNISIADPTDRGSLDICGFDTATPQIIHHFSCGNF